MRGLQGSFPHCRKHLLSDIIKQWLVIESIVLIPTFWAGVVGYNHIATVFDLEYEQVVNLEEYDRISQFYFCPGEYETYVDM